ncbi:MAG: SIR2 family protein [Ruminococcus sp.]|nr:SIR2 family protein [Ruminococcus sp.]
MRIYLSFSSDKNSTEIYGRLKRSLIGVGYDVTSSLDIFVEPVEFIADVIRREILDSDIMIAIVSEEYSESAMCRTELNIARQNNITVIPVVIDSDVLLPFSLHNVQYIQVRDGENVTEEVTRLLSKLSKANESDKQLVIEENTSKTTNKGNREGQIKILKKALENNQLTLICGAGISIAPGIPSWNQLLIGLLNMIYSNEKDKKSAYELLKYMPQSNLILGKYLHLALGKKFEEAVKNELYLNLKSDALNTPMLNAISGLARPKRSGVRLESVITFNFDDLIESKLTKENINHRPIWQEGQSHDTNELPIYHVHGFLPNRDNFDSPNLVLDEESYHSQFIDPYSWSNLTLLNAFSSNRCLFVGLSLSDPNLRRLLDISYRRNQKVKHFILKSKLPDSVTSDSNKKLNEKAIDTANNMFEQDALALGLKVLWYNEHKEIPEILKSISE